MCIRNVKQVSAALVFLVLFIAGCRKDIQEDQQLKPSLRNETLSVAKPSKLTPEQQAKAQKIIAALPAGYEKRARINANLLLKIHPEYRDLVNRALAVTPTTCNANTAINVWLGEQLADWDNTVIFLAITTGMLDFPTYDALLFENSSKGQYFGVNGEYTHLITKTFKDLQRFWNIQSANIVLAAMHGDMLLDRERVIRIDKALYGESQQSAEQYAKLISQLLEIFPQYRGGNHPIFTFNAFAQSAFDFPPFGRIPSKIVMGDGILEGFAAIGYADVATQAILAHEFGHHIQFQLNLFGNVRSPEATRRTELMADAYSAYYLSHARGASMQWKRVRQFLNVFFNIGDCSFTNNGHHGTPTQRLAAAEWGYSIANNAQKQGHILTAQQFTALFEAKLPELVTK